METTSWPKHPNGTNKTIGEMTPEESRPLLRAAFLRSKLGQPTPECAYCGATEGLRVKCDGGGYIAPEYTCEDCFTGTDTGPCFDDLKEVA